MTDEQHIDDAIRNALLADDPGAVPVRLRARMAMVPDVAASVVAARGWHGHRSRLLVPALVVAAAVAVAVATSGAVRWGTPVATSRPAVAPSAPASPVFASPQPTVAATPSPVEDVVVLDPSQLTEVVDGTFALKGHLQYALRFADTVGWPFIIGTDPTNPSNDPAYSVRIVDMLENGHQIVSPQLTDAGIVWMETWYTRPPIDCTGQTGCGAYAGQPISWALNLTTFGGKTTRLDHGVDTGWQYDGVGSSARAPAMAASGARVAYAVPRPKDPGHADASTIVVRSLPDNRVTSRLDRDGYVPQLGVWGQALLFREAGGTGEQGSADPSDASLYLVQADGAHPQVVEDHVATAVIGDGGIAGDDRIAWLSTDWTGSRVHLVSLADQSRVDVVSAKSSGATDVVAVPATLALVGNGVAWVAATVDPLGNRLANVNAWHPGWATGRAVPILGVPDWLAGSDGRLLVSGPIVAAMVQTRVGAITPSVLFGQSASGWAGVDEDLASRIAVAAFESIRGPDEVADLVTTEDRGDAWRLVITGSVLDAKLDTATLDPAKMTIDVDKATGLVTVVASG